MTNLSELTNLFEVEAAARDVMGEAVYDYVAGGVADELTIRWNIEQYRALRLRPRVLRDVSKLDLKIELLGEKLAMPILVAPTANHRLLHVEGELATVRGGAMAGATVVVSSAANTNIQDIARVATQPLWFQLYAQPDRELTRDIVLHAESAGVKALCLTVDNPVEAARNREQRARVQLPAGVGHPNYLGRAHTRRFVASLDEVCPAVLNWDLVSWLASISHVPLLLKGILTPEDAEEAVRGGVAGIIVSNHGGRALDTVPATIEALPAITQQVAGRVPVLVDGGIRRGTDVLKALACGASATLVGRPVLYGLSVGGAEGVAHVLKTLRMELLAGMALTGRTTIAEIDRSVLW